MPDETSKGNVRLPVLPTGKPHISFSELATWLDCPYKHKLTYIDKLSPFDGNEHTHFGSHVHHGCEMFLKNGTVPIDEVVEKISNTWSELGYPDKDKWIEQARGILGEVPDWMDKTFIDWEPVEAEALLYENLDHLGHPDAHWKGYVDAVIKHKDKRGKEIVRIMDWKTTSWGWRQQKLREFKTNAQAAAYKIFWSRKFDIDMKDIRANFVLLKREGKQGARCQLVEVSVGPKTQQKVDAAIDKMLRAVKAQHWPKNKLSCRYCDFNATEHCEGVGNHLT